MSKRSILSPLVAIAVMCACNDGGGTGTNSKQDTAGNKKKETVTDFGEFGATYDTITPSNNYFKQKLTRLASGTSNEFYTELNYQGEKYSPYEVWTDDALDDGIVIKSIKLSVKNEVSFDFGSDCNSIEGGHFQYYRTSSPNILATCGCDEDFSKVRAVFLRQRPDYLSDEVIIWEKPYLMGDAKIIWGPKNSGEVVTFKLKNTKFKSAKSIQISKGLLVTLFIDDYFKDVGLQINTSAEGLDKLHFSFTGNLKHEDFKSISIVKL